MEMQPVESSNIKAIGYDPESQTLRVEFRNGIAANYRGVPPETYQAFSAAESKGKFFHAHIRGKV